MSITKIFDITEAIQGNNHQNYQINVQNTLQSSLPDTSIEGSVLEKSTLHARFSCSSYSIKLCNRKNNSHE